MTRQMLAGPARLAARTLALALALVPSMALAQGNASAAAAAMGGNYTAVARNFNAIAWNPANLALPGNSPFSIAFSPQLGMGTGPLTLTDLKDYEGQVVPAPVREAWLQKMSENGGQNVGGDINVTPLALSIGRIGISGTTTVRADGALPTALAELVFFGNAGRTGTATDLVLNDLGLNVNATSTVALAYGRKFGLGPLPDLSIGVTGKYIVGHGMASMADNGSVLTSNPIGVVIDAPVVLTDTGSFMNGKGYGLDVGAAWTFRSFRMGAVLQNVINTFKWDTENLYYIPVQVTFDQDNSETKVDSILPLSAAPAGLQEELRARVAESKYVPTIALGVAFSPIRRLTLAADLKQRVGDGKLELGPDTQIGVGAELRLIPLIPFRAGVTTVGDGMRMSGGLALELGIVNLQLAASVLNAEGRNDSGFGFTFSIGGR